MIRRIANLRYIRVAGLAAGAVAVAGTAVVITASAAGMTFGARPSSSTPPTADVGSATAAAVCSTFMQHFASDIGKSQAEINTAFQNAIGETLADEVKSGQVTQAQADKIKAALAGKTPCALPSAIRRPGAGKNAALGAYLREYTAAAAAALGVTETQLQTDLKGGQSLSQVGSAQHITEAEFRTKLTANLKPVLDKAVSDKKITAAQEQTLITRLQTGPLPLWNAAPKRPKAGASPHPSPTTTTT
jgi:hypothetical protein